MAKNDALVAGSPGEFGTGRVQPGTYRWEKFVYALHPTKDGKGVYMTADLTLADHETGDIIGTERNLVGFVTDGGKDREHKKVMMAPSPDGKRLAGTDDVDEEMILNLAKGDINFKDAAEEALFSGPFYLHRPGATQMRGNMTQLKEAFESLVGGNVWTNSKSLLEMEGYVFDMDRRPQTYGSKKEKESDTQYDVLVPVELISKPDSKGATKASTGKAKKTGTEPEDDAEATEVEAALLAAVGSDWTTHRTLISEVMESNEDLMPAVLKYAKQDDWMFSEDRPWESNPEKKSYRKKGKKK
jgi:hypothetical protein